MKEQIINYLQSMMNEFKKCVEREGFTSRNAQETLSEMIACKEMAEVLLEQPVNLGLNGVVTIGF